MVTTYAGWVANGKPALPCLPVADLKATLARHGVMVEWYPDETHQRASLPEDHCPYSHTPWPVPQPYPNVMAGDIVGPGWERIGQQMVADKLAGVSGTEPIKYINWTDPAGRCWEDSWMPGHTQKASTDRGHTHFSVRTDFVHSEAMVTYDPYLRSLQGGPPMAFQDDSEAKALCYRVEALITDRPTVVGSIAINQRNVLHERLDRIESVLTKLVGVLPPTSSVTAAEIVDELVRRLAVPPVQ